VSHNRWHPEIEPIAEIALGEEVRLETEEMCLARPKSHR